MYWLYYYCYYYNKSRYARQVTVYINSMEVELKKETNVKGRDDRREGRGREERGCGKVRLVQVCGGGECPERQVCDDYRKAARSPCPRPLLLLFLLLFYLILLFLIPSLLPPPLSPRPCFFVPRLLVHRFPLLQVFPCDFSTVCFFPSHFSSFNIFFPPFRGRNTTGHSTDRFPTGSVSLADIQESVLLALSLFTICTKCLNNKTLTFNVYQA